MRRKGLNAVLLAAGAAAVLLAGCDLFADPPPYDIEVERPRRSDTLIVGEPFRVKARLEGDRTIQGAEVVVYRNPTTPRRDTVFFAPVPVPPDTRTLRIDTMLTIDSLSGPPGNHFVLYARLRMKDRGGGRGPNVTILESEE